MDSNYAPRTVGREPALVRRELLGMGHPVSQPPTETPPPLPAVPLAGRGAGKGRYDSWNISSVPGKTRQAKIAKTSPDIPTNAGLSLMATSKQHVPDPQEKKNKSELPNPLPRRYDAATLVSTRRGLGEDAADFVDKVCLSLRADLLALPPESRSIRRVNRFLYSHSAIKVPRFGSLLGLDAAAEAVCCGTGVAIFGTSPKGTGRGEAKKKHHLPPPTEFPSDQGAEDAHTRGEAPETPGG